MRSSMLMWGPGCGRFGLPEEEEEVQVVWPRIHTQQAQEILLF